MKHRSAPLSAEFRFLLAMLRASMANGQPADDSAQAGRDLDWTLLLALAARHRVTPALAEGLRRLAIAVPPPIQEKLDQITTQAVLDELSLAASLGEICRRAAQDRLQIAVLKGIALSFLLHGRLGLRISRDIDLLVAPDDAGQALSMLADLGFRPVGGEGLPDRDRLAHLIRRKKDIELFHPIRQQLVELHWRLFDNPRLLARERALSLERVALPMGLDLLVLQPQFNLLYLANHGSQHGWSRLKWLADFSALAARSDGAALAALYRDTPMHDGRRALAQALLLSHDLFGLPLAPDFARILGRDWRIRALQAGAMHCLTASGPAELETLHFGSTIKNLSHYLLSSAPSYLLAEMRQDLADMSAAPPGAPPYRFGFAGRLFSWLARHCFPRTGSRAR